MKSLVLLLYFVAALLGTANNITVYLISNCAQLLIPLYFCRIRAVKHSQEA